ASVTEVVRVRALVDATMPVIAQRSAALRAELAQGQRLAETAEAARRQVAGSRDELAAKVAQFSALERTALARADRQRRISFVQQDQMMAGGEDLLDLRSAAQRAAAARALARALVREPLAPPRPFAGEGRTRRPQLLYRLPSPAPVIEGLGEVSPVGVRSRGIRLATSRGAALTAPAAGTILFAGAFREHDGIIVIDHGRGWTSLLIDVAPSVQQGDAVAAGAPLGRALGDVQLELRQAGQPRSAALIAGSSRLLSNGAKTR
ncbi:MAG: peptidoglycan DD-metalloendopeptidase family protein, partial [Pseudomonadota bacterium]|nr:peptidoglycan DD-metalloendopeptidase family protein [Pseudomonadota bacterium]